MTNEKHPHVELIHAWADGAEIEVYYPDGGWQLGWVSCRSPDWNPSAKYRIKPKVSTAFYRTDAYLWADEVLRVYTISGDTELYVNNVFENYCKCMTHVYNILPLQKIEVNPSDYLKGDSTHD